MPRHIPTDGGDGPLSVVVLGDDPVARQLAMRFDDRHDVTYAFSEDPPPAPSVPGVEADPRVRSDLAAAGVGDADVVLVATGSDATNLLAGRLALTLGAGRVVAFVYDPGSEDSIRRADIETVDVTSALEAAVAERVDG